MSRRLMRHIAGLAVAALLLSAPCPLAAKKKNPEDSLRTVQGTVTDAGDKPVDGVVVQLKDTKTLQVRSFITQQHGSYYFHGLSPNVDYELRAEFEGAASPTKTVSSFDSRKQAIINLKLSKK